MREHSRRTPAGDAGEKGARTGGVAQLVSTGLRAIRLHGTVVRSRQRDGSPMEGRTMAKKNEKTVTVSAVEFEGLMARLDRLEKAAKAEKAPKKAPKKAKKAPKKVREARKHCYEARMARRADASRKGGAGMTKAEKSALYAELIKKNGGERPTTRQWNAACKKARGL